MTKLEKSMKNRQGDPISLLATLTSFYSKFLAVLIGTITVLASLNIGIMFLCIFICIPTLIVSMKMAVTQYEIYTKRFEGLRFIAYLKDNCDCL